MQKYGEIFLPYIKKPQIDNMEQKKEQNLISFLDIDLYTFNSIARHWNLDCIQLKPGKFLVCVTQYIADNFQFGHAKFNLAAKQEGISPEGVWTFALVNEKKLYWRNYKVQPNSVIIYAPGSEINAVSSADFEVVVFSVPDVFLAETAKKMNMEAFYHSLKTIELFETKESLWSQLKQSIIKELFKHKQNPAHTTKLEFINKLSRDLLFLLQNSGITTNTVSGKKRLKLLHDAEVYIMQNLTEHFSVFDIASHLNVSERTLLYAFNNRFGKGTKGFMKDLTLNHVYHALHKGDDISSIANIARASGFWHMGQFYKDYKRFFGELPSETLKRAIKKNSTF